ncbi:MAG: hypothetical protein WC082_04360, partial [Victivallales bacterium]
YLYRYYWLRLPHGDGKNMAVCQRFCSGDNSRGIAENIVSVPEEKYFIADADDIRAFNACFGNSILYVVLMPLTCY